MAINDEIMLAIETAIGGGSISLSINGAEIDHRVGTQTVSRAENLLPQIAEILKTHGLRRADIGVFAVSTGPGSFTGIRVGIATALGLKAAIRARFIGITSLQAMAVASNSELAVAAVPMGRGVICCQQFRNNVPSSEPLLLGSDELSAYAEQIDGVLVYEGSLRDSIGPPRSTTIDVGYNIAGVIASAARAGYGGEDLSPLFVDRK